MIKIDAEDRVIADPLYPSQFWREWVDGRAADAMHEPSQLLFGWSRLVVVAPHPDDEVLMGGGLIQLAVSLDMDIVVVAVTDGEACFGPGDDQRRIAALRRDESAAGLQALGAHEAQVHHVVIPDGKVAAHLPGLRQALVSLLIPTDVVLTTWHLDGHPDHDAAGECVAAIAKIIGCRVLYSPVWMWHWATPDHPAIPWETLRICHLSAHASERKASALGCHRSQIKPHGAAKPVVDEALLARARWPFESYFIS